MWKIKGCPKCHGDVFIDKDMDGWFEKCLQCGYTHYMSKVVEVSEEPVVRKRKRERVLVGAGRHDRK